MNSRSWYIHSLSVLLFLCCTVIVHAQTDKGIAELEEAKSICNEIVREFNIDNMSSAFVKIRNVLNLPDNEIDYLEKESIKQTNVIINNFGACVGHKLVSEQLIDEVYYRLVYVVKHEGHGLRLIFDFYNGKGSKWYMNSFKWDDSLSELFNN